MTFADQSDWPKERVGGWAPGMYFCRCKECRAEYMGDKRSWLCYPCTKNAGPTPDYTGEGSAWVPPAVAPAVVVPEVPMGTALQRLGLRLTQILDGHEFAVLEHEFLNPAIEEMQKLSVLSGRVLGEGMAQISGRELACMRAELEYRRAESDEAPDSVLDPLWDAFNALRASQGGAEHGNV